MLLSPETFRSIRTAVCAVGYLTVPKAEYLRDLSRPYYKVVGTGFLVRPTTVITNRHVIEALLKSQQDLGFPDAQRQLMFVEPYDQAGWQVGVSPIVRMGTLQDHHLDVGFCEFAARPGDAGQQPEALSFRTTERIEIGDPVVVCGYPYGHAMLHRDGKVYRWGPVVQQGWVSALSPYDTALEPDELLLDVRSAGGMSGAPIFRPTDGKVIAILHSGWEATTTLALPLTAQAVATWLAAFDPPQPNPANAADRRERL